MPASVQRSGIALHDWVGLGTQAMSQGAVWPLATMRHRSSDCAVCYVTDMGFLFPALASAMSLRTFESSHDTEIFIVGIGLGRELVEALGRRFNPYGITFLTLKPLWRGRYDEAKFARFHVPDSSLGRLFLEACLPPHVRHIIYLDGDTLVQGDPASLLALRVSEGYLAAADDHMAFCASDFGPHGNFLRGYFAGLGLDSTHRYFNAGVLAASRSTWRDLSREAFALFVKHTEACVHHDQSALNVVAGARRVRLSIRWNYQTLFDGWSGQTIGTPAIRHFAGRWKPWADSRAGASGFGQFYANVWTMVEDLGLPRAGGTASPSARAAGLRAHCNRILRLGRYASKRRELRRVERGSH